MAYSRRRRLRITHCLLAKQQVENNIAAVTRNAKCNLILLLLNVYILQYMQIEFACTAPRGAPISSGRGDAFYLVIAMTPAIRL